MKRSEFWESQIPRRFTQHLRDVPKTGTTFSAAHQGTETQRVGAIVGECHSPFGKVAAGPTPVCHPTALDVQVAELKAKFGRCGSGTRCTRCAEAMWNPSGDQDPFPKRRCRREEFLPYCDEEMQAAMVAGRLPEVARVSHLLTKAQEWQQLIQQQSLMLSAVVNSVR